MPHTARFIKYTFQGRSGHILGSSTACGLLAIGHTAYVAPWTDPAIHWHENSEEYYLLLEGELRFWVWGLLLTLRPREILMLRPRVAHAIVGGEGRIEHFGIRTPAPHDKQTVGEVPCKLQRVNEESERALQRDWGFRISLEAAGNRNCWLIGVGAAKFQSAHLTLAFLDFPTTEAANAGIGTRHRLHFHERSWEYYAVLKGTKTLQMEKELATIEAGEILEVPPQVSHSLYARQAPYMGFTLRVPAGFDDKVAC